MSPTPTISVLMPVYNAERYVAEAVESVLGQTFTDFEFLIVDDGSTDGSPAILRKYAARDPRIRLISRPNTGLVVALNEMLGLARGEFAARMDADDISLSDRLERQVAYLRGHPDCVAVGTRVELIDADGDRLCEFHGPTAHEAIDAAHLTGGGGAAITHPSLLARRAAVAAAGGYDPAFYPAEDVDLFLRLAERGRLANLPEVLLRYRRHLAATGHVYHTRQVDAKQRAAAAARRRRGLPEAPAAAGPSRPVSVPDQFRMWAWWALGAGNVRTARKHAWAALRRAPLSPGSWKVALCTLRGR